MNTALLICEDAARSQSVIHALEEDYEVWQVARQRDAMAWLRQHHPRMVVIDLDLDGLDPGQLLDALRADPVCNPVIIGISRATATIPAAISGRLDQLLHQ